jgi:hypothetical protein
MKVMSVSSLTSLSPDLDGLYEDTFLARGLHTGC